MQLTASTGLRYLEELRLQGHKSHGYLIRVDQMFRTEIQERLIMNNDLDLATTFAQVLLDRRDIWITAAQGEALDRMTPTAARAGTKRSADNMDEDDTMTQPKGQQSSKHKRHTVAQLHTDLPRQLHIGDRGSSSTAQELNSAQAPAQMARIKPSKSPGNSLNKTNRIPELEYAALTKFKERDDHGRRFCQWYNCSLGCLNNSCPYSHTCCQCGARHSWAWQHR